MNVSNAQLNVATNDTLYGMSKGRFNVGKIAENDLLQSELALLNARTQYQNALVELRRAAQSLNHVLRLPPTSVVIIRPDENIPRVEVDQEKAVEFAREYQSDEINLRVQELTAARGVRQAESDNSLSMSITANIGLNQKANELNAVYRDLLDQQQFSVQLQVPLVGWGVGSHAIEAARAEETRVLTSAQSQRFTIDQEVQYQVQRFRQLQWQVGVAAKADTIAQRRFEVARDRFVIGKIDIPNLFLAQSEKDNAYRARIQALWDHWTTYYRLRRLTLYDFATDRALMSEVPGQ
jgi:outer membrane protein TolC